MNDIAARAGVGKALIYRRWSSKAALIADALVYWRPELLSEEAPDTGSLVGDLEWLIGRAARNDNDLISNDLILRVALAAAHEPELASALDDLMLMKGRRLMSTILRQAVSRAEIPADRDWSLVADVVTAMGLMRVISGQTVDAKFVREVIDRLVVPAVHAPVSTSPAPTRRSPKTARRAANVQRDKPMGVQSSAVQGIPAM